MAAEETALMKGKSASALVGQEIAYPKNIRTIPYASYFQLMRWEYKKGVSESSKATKSRDVLSKINNNTSGLANKIIDKAASGTFGQVESKMNKGANQTKEITELINTGFKNQRKFANTQHNKKIEAAKDNNDYSGFNYPLTLKDGSVIENPEQLKDKKKAQNMVVKNEFSTL